MPAADAYTLALTILSARELSDGANRTRLRRREIRRSHRCTRRRFSRRTGNRRSPGRRAIGPIESASRRGRPRHLRFRRLRDDDDAARDPAGGLCVQLRRRPARSRRRGRCAANSQRAAAKMRRGKFALAEQGQGRVLAKIRSPVLSRTRDLRRRTPHRGELGLAKSVLAIWSRDTSDVVEMPCTFSLNSSTFVAQRSASS